MITISLCMIVKNEEEVLGRCLSSVAGLVEEIIIVDTGSSDKTRQIAAEYQARIADFPWIDDFAAARNYAFSLATQDYILWLDADDVLPESERAEFLRLKQTLPACIDMVVMNYHTAFDASGRATFSFPRERLVRRGAGLKWQGAVHETIPFVPMRMNSDIAIEHHKLHCQDPDRNLRILEKERAKGPLNVRQQYYYARELADHRRYAEAAEAYETFLDNPEGWAENKIDACQGLYRCLRQLKQPVKAFQSLTRAFLYAPPRSETACALGSYFFEFQDYVSAVFWYRLALELPMPWMTGGFINPDCYGYIPWIQLCCCYDKLKDWKKAWEANEQAAEIKPDDPSVKHNRSYLQTVITPENS